MTTTEAALVLYHETMLYELVMALVAQAAPGDTQRTEDDLRVIPASPVASCAVATAPAVRRRSSALPATETAW